MREGIHNVTLKKIEGMLEKAKMQIDKDLNGVRPFDKVKLSSKEVISQFMNLDPQVKQALAQQNPEAYAGYEQEINKLITESE